MGQLSSGPIPRSRQGQMQKRAEQCVRLFSLCSHPACKNQKWPFHMHKQTHQILLPGKQEAFSQFKDTFQLGENTRGRCHLGRILWVKQTDQEEAYLAPAAEVCHPWSTPKGSCFAAQVFLITCHLVLLTGDVRNGHGTFCMPSTCPPTKIGSVL